jgi:hypothetical protein
MSEELKDKVYATIKNAWNMVGILHEKPTLGDALDLATEKVMNEVVESLRTENARITKELEEIKLALQIEEHDNEYNCAERDKLKEENARLRALTEWQPIESAPRDASLFLCYAPDYYNFWGLQKRGMAICRMKYIENKWECIRTDGVFYYPTLWKPLDAPQIEGK